MADEDARRGIRALISGGVYGIDSDGLQALGGAVADAQRQRGIAPSIPEVDYLQEYSKICEKRLTHVLTEEDAQYQLDVLNTKYLSLSDSFRRKSIPSPEVAEEDDWEDSDWYGSSYDC